MKFISYIIVYSLLWLISKLPDRIIYLFSDFLYFLAYYIVRYRKKVVFRNISLAFPDYTEKQVRKLARKFYSHFADVIIESSLMLFVPYEKSMKKLVFRNTELIDKLYQDGKLIVGISAHYGNWEYLVQIEEISDYRFLAIYKPLKNKYFDRLVRKTRARYGSIPVAMKEVGRKLFEMKRKNEIAISVFLTDQRPIWEHIQYWTKFLGLDTPVYLGPEKLAIKLDAAVVFMVVKKIKRGYYELAFELITEKAANEKPYTITEAHVRKLERAIREEPEYWLWSHKRWKFNYEDYRLNHPNYKKSIQQDQ